MSPDISKQLTAPNMDAIKDWHAVTEHISVRLSNRNDFKLVNTVLLVDIMICLYISSVLHTTGVYILVDNS